MERIQMTEEQFIQMYRNCGRGMIGSQNYEDWRLNMIKYGYIRKSELQQKVEEAEQLWQEMKSNGWNFTPFEQNMYNIIQLLKQSHPEFNEE